MVKNFFGSKKIWGQKNVGQFCLLHESSSWVKIGLHAENQLPGWFGSGLKVSGGGGGWLGYNSNNLVKPTSIWVGFLQFQPLQASKVVVAATIGIGIGGLRIW